MINLKKYFDAVNEAESEVERIALQIETHFDAGETEKALELKENLDSAKDYAKAAKELYMSMAEISSDGADHAQRFIPAEGVQVVRDEADNSFPTIGEFFLAVKNAALMPASEDPRLRALRMATGMSEGVPADGGYLLKPEVADGIIQAMYTVGDVLSRISLDPVGANSNSMTYNGLDETSRVAGSRWGGVRGYWVGEGDTLTGSKPQFRQVPLQLNKVAALCYATDEQLQDTMNLESWLGRVVPDELRFMAEDAIVEGDGVGKPLGVMNSPCLVEHTRLDASTVKFQDITGMWARRYAGVSDYVWYINQDVNPQLDALSLTVGSAEVPPRFIDYDSNGVMRIKGRPVVEVEYCQTLGTVGDILLASMSQYQGIDKGSIRAASSIHVQFVTDETAFRFIYRIDGAPMWHSAITPLHGSNTVSPFVALSTSS